MTLVLQPRSALSRGFTLMELTVVLVIVGLLLGGLLVPLSAQRDVDSIRAAEKSLADVREALIGFVVINGRLPCPAQADIASGTAGAGMEAVTVAGGPCACASTASPGGAAVATYGSVTPCSAPAGLSTDTVRGVLPWATLGLLEIDPWMNRFTYHMSAYFGRANTGQTLFGTGCTPSSNPAAAAFALCTPGGITLNTAASGGTTLASSVPAVVVAHGKNGLGAWTTQGSQLPQATAGADEAENLNGDATFVSNTNIDDRLIWIPTSLLMSRMLAAGKLP